MVIVLLYPEMFSKISACNVCVFVFCCAAPNSDIILRSLYGRRRQSVELEVNVYEEMKKECIGTLFQDVTVIFIFL